MFGPSLKTVEAGDLWIEDRNFCTRDFLCDITNRGAFFITREHLGLCSRLWKRYASAAERRRAAWRNSGSKWWIAQGQEHVFRRVRIKLKHATRDGATIVHMRTNLPAPGADTSGCGLYRKRWTLETAFQHLEAYFHSEIHTLGYPKAALFGFCLALVA